MHDFTKKKDGGVQQHRAQQARTDAPLPVLPLSLLVFACSSLHKTCSVRLAAHAALVLLGVTHSSSQLRLLSPRAQDVDEPMTLEVFVESFHRACALTRGQYQAAPRACWSSNRFSQARMISRRSNRR